MASTTKTSGMTKVHSKNLGLNKHKKNRNSLVENHSIDNEDQKLYEDVNYIEDEPEHLEETEMSQDFDDFDFVSHRIRSLKVYGIH